MLLGTIAFAGIGLLMAGTLRGEVNLAAANGLYLVLLLLGGMIIPLDELPAALEAIAASGGCAGRGAGWRAHPGWGAGLGVGACSPCGRW